MCAACIERNISSHCFSICQFAYLLFPSVSVCPCVSLSNSVWLSFYINLSLYFSFFLVAQLFDSLTVCRSIGPLVLFHEWGKWRSVSLPNLLCVVRQTDLLLSIQLALICSFTNSSLKKKTLLRLRSKSFYKRNLPKLQWLSWRPFVYKQGDSACDWCKEILYYMRIITW